MRRGACRELVNEFIEHEAYVWAALPVLCCIFKLARAQRCERSSPICIRDKFIYLPLTDSRMINDDNGSS